MLQTEIIIDENNKFGGKKAINYVTGVKSLKRFRIFRRIEL